MNKIRIIILREYLTRVKKRSFLVMTILGPVLLAAIFIIPVYLAKISDQPRKIGIIDETGFFFEAFLNSQTNSIHFEPVWDDIQTARENFDESGYHALLFIPQGAISAPSTIRLMAKKQVNVNITSHVESILRKEIESHKLSVSGIDKSVLLDIQTPVKVSTVLFTDTGEEKYSFAEVSMILGLIAGILIYIFIFSFGSQVMRGVIEEKTSRIVEIIVSSVKPFELMMGKIIGIALVGLTQFLLWILLSFAIITGFQISQPEKFSFKEPSNVMMQNKGLTQLEIEQLQQNESIVGDEGNKILEGIYAINFHVVILMFLFYFIFGYLMYAALFAAIGSAVDSEADTQQFMLPVTVPLILAIVMAQFIINNPDGNVAFWLSIIPFTSPIIMMVRIPFNPPVLEVVLSMVLLVGAFFATTWLAAKIYRTGILMYGKKSNYRELWKWLLHR
jgi:ABC-2 type transport system permease protein